MKRINNHTGPHIVVVGGGTGLSVILRGIKHITNNLTAVVSVADDGGSSGDLREDLGMLPPGDIRSCILALADEEDDMQQLLRYRFEDGRLLGHNFGNLLIAALNQIYGNFEEAVARTSEILRITGRVLPVTSDNVCLCAELENGEIICGESKIPKAVLKTKSSIKRVFLEPIKPAPSNEAIEAILSADMVVIGPGSLYTSIVPNLLVDGISQAIQESPAIKTYICNVMTQPGETTYYGVYEHVKVVNEYLGDGILDYVIVNNRKASDEVLAGYISDGSEQFLMTEKDKSLLSETSITIVENDFLDVQMGYIRHDAERIASIILNIVYA